MTQLTINSDTSLQAAIGDLREAYKAHKFLRVDIKTGKARSLDQNAISHTWYEQIARELREDTPLGVKNTCKLFYGVPILRSENAEFRKHYDCVFLRLTYEQKMEAMTHLPVTSLMTKPQLSQYLEAMQSAYAARVQLTFPEQEAA
jgi:hypothetical protein